jgi:hypothetical protein
VGVVVSGCRSAGVGDGNVVVIVVAVVPSGSGMAEICVVTIQGSGCNEKVKVAEAAEWCC